MSEVKPCPFCGEAPLVHEGPDMPDPHEAGSWIMCRNSECLKPAVFTTTDPMGNQGDFASVLEKWNRRDGC